LTAGSRGIANLPLVLRTVVQFLMQMGARPFLVPAMGSHGGATAEGQERVLASFGITEDSMGVPIRSSMDVESLGTTEEGYPLIMSREAARADHIGVIARVKPHTGFHGAIESGLFKMMMIGLGKHDGAAQYHRLLLDLPWDDVVRSVGRRLCAKAHIRFGVGLVENAFEETARLEVLAPKDFEEGEEELLKHARQWMGRLPYPQADLLIVDEIGKDVSGTGMDTNVVGRKSTSRFHIVPGLPTMRHIFVRGLTERTAGNATGIGLADFTTTAVVKAMDYRATVINCLTAGHAEAANLPVHLETDREVIDAALGIIGSRAKEDARVMRIRSTAHLEEVEVSEACLREGKRVTEFHKMGKAREMEFDERGSFVTKGQG
jgi:hypothetical protein